MKLSEQQRSLLHVIELDGDLEAAEIAKRTKLKPEVIRRLMRSFVDSGLIVGRTAVIDIARLGLFEYGVNLSLAGREEAERERFIAYLTSFASVSWIAETGGEFDIMANVTAPGPHEVNRIFDKVLTRFPRSIEKRIVCQRGHRMRFPRRLFGGTGRGPRFSLNEVRDSIPLDYLDSRILFKLSQSEFQSMREFARELGIPITTFQRRVSELRSRNVLLGFGYRVNVESLNAQTYRLLISSRAAPTKLKSSLTKFSAAEGIKLLVETIGAWDFEMEVDVLTAGEIRSLVRALKSRFEHEISSVMTVPIFKHLKYVSFPPLKAW